MRKRTWISWMAAVAAVCLLAGCSEGQQSATAGKDAAAASTNVQTYIVKGVVKKLDPSQKRVSIQHEEIPGFMEAMTMPFNVRNPAELSGLNTNDTVTFRLSVTDESSWIDQIQKVQQQQGLVTPLPANERPSVRIVREVEPLQVGDQIPNYRFTNELGKAVSLEDFKGKAVALTFIFTRCPMPEFCPLMARNFKKVYDILEANPNAPKNWHLLSISFDPHFDTPAILKSYAKQYGYNPEKWSFVTGAMEEIDGITEQFGVEVFKQGESWDHKLRTAVIDANGQVQKIFIYNEWKPEELAEEVIKAAQVPAPAATTAP